MAAIVAEGQQSLQAIRDQSPPRFSGYWGDGGGLATLLLAG